MITSSQRKTRERFSLDSVYDIDGACQCVRWAPDSSLILRKMIFKEIHREIDIMNKT